MPSGIAISANLLSNFGEFTQQNGQNCSVILPGLLTNPARFTSQKICFCTPKGGLLDDERWFFG